MKEKIFKVLKIVLKVLGILLALLLVAAIALIIYFWPFIKSVDWSIVNASNLKALYMAYTTDAEKLMEQERVLDEKRADEIKKYLSVQLRDFTDEELKMIESGEKTRTEIVAQIISENVQSGPIEDVVTGDNTAGNQGANVQTGEQPNPQPKPKAKEVDAIVAKHISNLYAIQGEFQARVDSLVASAKNWAAAYVKSQGVTWREAKIAGVNHFTSTASAIESDCYARVDAEIEALRKDLEAIGADLSIVETIRQSAYNEMELKKAKIVQFGKSKMN